MNELIRTILPPAFLFNIVCSEDTEKKPLNVVMIVSDDMRKELGCYGSSHIHSPNIDRLARKGRLFTRAYAQATYCGPSRASFLTGLRTETLNVRDNATSFRDVSPEGTVTIPEWFRKYGYQTVAFGKVNHIFDDTASWDLEKRRRRPEDPDGYAETQLGREGLQRRLAEKPAGRYWRMSEGGDEDHLDGQITRDAVEFLTRDHDQPFFLGVGLHKPHAPYVAPKKYFDLYPLEEIQLNPNPESTGPLASFAVPETQGVSTEQDKKEFLRGYYACVSYADAQVGKILDIMDQKNLWDNTIILFLADHGYDLGERGHWGKTTLFERVTSAPLIVWAPGMIDRGEATEEIVEFIDFFPTLTELCGLPQPENLEGASFAQALKSREFHSTKAGCTEVYRGSRRGATVRLDNWRYTEWTDPGGNLLATELYNRTEDPGEYHNLCENPEYLSVINHLKKFIPMRGGTQGSLIQHLMATQGVQTDEGGVVTSWADQSGKANDASPLIGEAIYPSTSLTESGLAGVDFGDDYNSLQLWSVADQKSWLDFNNAAAFNSGFAVFVSIKVDSLPPDDPGVGWSEVFGNASVGQHNGLVLRFNNLGILQAMLDGNVVTDTSAERVEAGDTLIMGVNYNKESGLIEFWDSLNNETLTSTIEAGNFSMNDREVGLGTTGDDRRWLRGMVGEVRVYNSVLDATMIEEVQKEMVDTWVIP